MEGQNYGSVAGSYLAWPPKGGVPSSQGREPMTLIHYKTGNDLISLVRDLVRMGHLLRITYVVFLKAVFLKISKENYLF